MVVYNGNPVTYQELIVDEGKKYCQFLKITRANETPVEKFKKSVVKC